MSVNEKLSKEAVIATCKNHLCPVINDPLHHSELEVWIGAHLGWDLFDIATGESFESYEDLSDRVKEVVDDTLDSYKKEQAFCTRITQDRG